MRLCRWLRSPLFAGVLLSMTACGGGQQTPPPQAGDAYGAVPSLQGHAVMVMPVQASRGVPGSADAEIAFALEERSTRTDWILPAEMRNMLARSPAVQVNLDALPVGMFAQGQVRRVGDPLFGELRRMAALTGSDLVVIPIEVLHAPGPDASGGRVEIAATLMNARNGRVFWFGVVEGEPGEAGDPRALASAADALARALIW